MLSVAMPDPGDREGGRVVVVVVTAYFVADMVLKAQLMVFTVAVPLAAVSGMSSVPGPGPPA